MTNKEKRRYRIRNWRDYNAALVRRGSLTLWVEQGVAGRWRDTASPAGRGRRRRTYSDLAITCALTLREVYGLPLRPTQGLVRSVLRSREIGRDEWKKEASYHCRSLAETAMMRLKMIFSDRLRAREWRRQETELRVRCAALNRMTALGMPHSYAV